MFYRSKRKGMIQMGKSVYSLVLMDEVVDAIDQMAYRNNTSRSNLINQILAEHVSLATPEKRMKDVFTSLEQFMDELAENGYGAISRKTGASEALVREECDLIRSLNPRPGTGFSRRENLSYVTPDVLVLPGEDEELEVQVNGGGLPPLDLSVYYSNLLLETPDEEVRLYLSEKLNQARSIVENINGRQALLERCAKKIVAEQEEFFRKGHGYLRPLELQQAADALGVSKEWIRCAVKDKYLQCPQGIYPMSWFFTRESMSDE